MLQELDVSETERRRQRNRNRIHVELAVPKDLAQMLSPRPSRLLDESEDRWRVADPEGNELVTVRGA